jgi:hypothetical protein
MKTIIRNNCPPPLGIFLISILMLFSQVSLAQDGYFEQGYGGETDEGGKAVYVKLDHSSIMAIETAAQVFIYPNPNQSGSAVIVLSQPVPDEARMDVCFTDMVGKTVWQGTLTALQLRQVDISMLPVGWYVVNITGPDGMMLKSKFIKQ